LGSSAIKIKEYLLKGCFIIVEGDFLLKNQVNPPHYLKGKSLMIVFISSKIKINSDSSESKNYFSIFYIFAWGNYELIHFIIFWS